MMINLIVTCSCLNFYYLKCVVCKNWKGTLFMTIIITIPGELDSERLMLTKISIQNIFFHQKHAPEEMGKRGPWIV
jgi:hypothetical protein